jgi:hypothetical protein
MSNTGLVLNQFTSAVIELIDGSVAPLSVQVPFDNGDFTFGPLDPDLRETSTYESRGEVVARRRTTRIYPTLSLSAMIEKFTDPTVAQGTVYDFLLAKAGTDYAARVTTADGTTGRFCSEVFHCDVRVTWNNNGETSTITFQDVQITIDFAEGDPSNVTLNGTIYGNITGDIVITVLS